MVVKRHHDDCKSASHRDGEAICNTYISQRTCVQNTHTHTHTPTDQQENKKQK